jgi:hypothetical protein
MLGSSVSRVEEQEAPEALHDPVEVGHDGIRDNRGGAREEGHALVCGHAVVGQRALEVVVPLGWRAWCTALPHREHLHICREIEILAPRGKYHATARVAQHPVHTTQ